MKSVKIKKGFDLNIKGCPEKSIQRLKNPAMIAIMPEQIPFVKPRLLVKQGNHVKIGTPVFEDKRNSLIQFLSPGSGVVEEINFGPRRVIKEIIIRLDSEEKHERFKAFSITEINKIERKELVSALLKGGLWPFIRQLPFRDIANPDFIPPSIFVNIGNLEAFHPSPEIYLQENKKLFLYGLKILEKLSKKVFVYTSDRNHVFLKEYNDTITHIVSGQYPADDPGVMLYHIKKNVAENKAWYLSAENLCLIASLLETGKYPVERTVCVGGPGAKHPLHFKTRAGVPFAHISSPDKNKKKKRYIAGGIFNGHTASRSSFMGFYETSLTLVEEGDEKEFFGFIRPGADKYSYSKTFLSAFSRRAFKMDCGTHGEERACINCSYCDRVCPVDIFPQFAMKAILSEEIDEALSLGLLDCVECGLCSYVCPSKIELGSILKQARFACSLEQA